MLVELLGGPHDGALLSRSRKPQPYVWVGGDPLRLHKQPAGGLELYCLRGAEPVGDDLVLRFHYAQNRRVKCESCGWFVPSQMTCVLCGSSLRA